MKRLLGPTRRKLVASGLMRAFSLASAALLVSEFIWEATLKIKAVTGIIVLVTLFAAWIICPEGEWRNGSREEKL